MIHYHGTPLSSRITAVKVLTGRHALVSHSAPDHIEVAGTVCQSFVLDNGAFSHFRKGNAITDWRKYYKWCDKWLAHPCCDWALIPDVIDGNGKDNDELLEEWPHGMALGVPVYHMHEPLARLTRLSHKWPRVALGSSGKYWKVGSKVWWRRMDDMLTSVCDSGGSPRCKLHGLRMLNYKIFTRLPLASADSVNVGMNCGRSAKLYEVDAAAGAEVIVARIEAHNSTATWQPLK